MVIVAINKIKFPLPCEGEVRVRGGFISCPPYPRPSPPKSGGRGRKIETLNKNILMGKG